MILFLVNLSLLTIVYFVMRNSPRQRKLVFLTTIYAYFLSVLLPYLLLWIPPKWLVLSYIIAIAVALWVIDMLLSEPEDQATPLDDKKAEQNNKIDIIESLGNLRQNFSTATLATNRIDMIETLDHREILREDPVKAYTKAPESEREVVPLQTITHEETPALDPVALSESRNEDAVIESSIYGESDIQVPEVTEVNVGETAAGELTAAGDDSLAEENPLGQVVDAPVLEDSEQVEALPDEAGETIEGDRVGLSPEQMPNDEVDAEAAPDDSGETDFENIVVEQPAVAVEPVEALQEIAALADEIPEQLLEVASSEAMDEPAAEEVQSPSDEIQVLNLEGLDIDALIELGFEAKFKDEYTKAVQIFEYLLSQNPPVKVAALILEDIEIMRTKLI
ncbi:MAG TPA: hypothetical protein VN426_00730 [Syntrophomonadaceae bacterium]|nr:hypothetical protein [Syntrophomonadaceae bacterium]